MDHQRNGARSRRTRTAYRLHSDRVIHSSLAVSKQLITAAPFQHVIRGSRSCNDTNISISKFNRHEKRLSITMCKRNMEIEPNCTSRDTMNRFCCGEQSSNVHAGGEKSLLKITTITYMIRRKYKRPGYETCRKTFLVAFQQTPQICETFSII